MSKHSKSIILGVGIEDGCTFCCYYYNECEINGCGCDFSDDLYGGIDG